MFCDESVSMFKPKRDKQKSISLSFFRNSTVLKSKDLDSSPISSRKKHPFQDGKVVKDRYVIKKELGHGGMGRVFKALDAKEDNRWVALKILMEEGEEHRIRFKREYKFLRLVEHPNLVKAYDYFEEEKHSYIVLEFVQGRSLSDILYPEDPSLSLAEQLTIANHLTRAVEVLNTGGILHRDIKPENVMINSESGDVKLLDLGIGKDLSGDMRRLTASNSILGTLAYLSPEQSQGQFTDNSDVFSLGITLYQFFSWQSRSPFFDNNSYSILYKIRGFHPPTLEKIIEEKTSKGELQPTPEERKAYKKLSALLTKAMAKKTEKRLPGAKELVHHLAQIQSSLLDDENYKEENESKLLKLSQEIDGNLLKTLHKIKAENYQEDLERKATSDKLRLDWKKIILDKRTLVPSVLIILAIFLLLIPTNQVKEGFHTETYSNGDSYSGIFQNNKFNGKGTFLFANEDKYEGDFQNGKFHGQGTFTWKSGSTYTGDFVAERRTGKGSYSWPDGRKYKGEFKNNRLHGQGVCIYPNGDRYEGEFKNDTFHGEGKFILASGEVKYEGEWENNRFMGSE